MTPVMAKPKVPTAIFSKNIRLDELNSSVISFVNLSYRQINPARKVIWPIVIY
jgi:hypothetical protein